MKNAPNVPSHRYFISSLDTKLGHCIVDLIKHDFTLPDNPHVIFGTKATDGNGVFPDSVKKVINNTDISILSKTILDCDVIIYDLSHSKLDEVEYALKLLKMENYQGNKYFIVISSAMVWSDTPLKEKKEGDEDDPVDEGEEEPEPEPEPEQPPAEDGEEQEKKVYIAYKEVDYPKRRPLPKYDIFKSIETLCLSAGKSKPNLLTYVVCPGVIYGHGEHVFANYFKQAWLQDPKELSFLGDGKNLIPTIHVRDLAMFVHFIVKKTPAKRYIFAIDHTKRPSLKRHVETISKGVGTGKVKGVDQMEDEFLEIWKLNINLRPSTVIEEVEAKDQEAEENAPPAEEEEENPDNPDAPPKLVIPKFKFEWWCKDGIRKNIAKIVEEYNTFRGLKPIKIFLTGPPASGKTFFGKQLAQYYNIPHIVVGDFSKDTAADDEELSGKIQSYIEEEKSNQASKNEELLEEWKKKRIGPKPETDPEKIFPRLNDELLCILLRRRLAQNDCFNRGFVLDGYPKRYEDAIGVFMTTAIPKEGEEDKDPEELPKVLDWRKAPQFVIQLNASDKFLRDRVLALPEEAVAGTHNTEEGIIRRLKDYREKNTSIAGKPVLLTFFSDHNIEILKIPCETTSNDDIFKSLRVFVEKHGKFLNYQNHDEVSEEERKKQIAHDYEESKVQEAKSQTERDEREAEQRKIQDEKTSLKLEALKEQEKQKLEQLSRPLRQYLSINVVPFLTSGIVDICKNRPEDPVDFLAEYLFKKSLEVRFPDPGSIATPRK